MNKKLIIAIAAALILGACNNTDLDEKNSGDAIAVDSATTTDEDNNVIDTTPDGDRRNATDADTQTETVDGIAESTSTGATADSDSDTGTAVDTTDASDGTETVISDSATATEPDTQTALGATDSASVDTDTIDTGSFMEDSGTVDENTDSASDDSASDNDSDSETDTTDTAPHQTDSDPPPQSWCVADGMTPYTSADVLLVVDNSGSMAQEQEILATALFTLINSLANPGDDRPPIDDVRIAVTTTDMGVSYAGIPYNDEDGIFANEQVRCFGAGDNGAFVTDYTDDTINIMEGTIACDADASQCPPGWTCENSDTDTNGFCMDPNGTGEGVSCPPSPDEAGTSFIPDGRTDKSLAVACLAGNIGNDGCNYEQQLKSGSAALTNNGAAFIRPDSLTAIVVVSDEDDCSIASDAWHELDELQKVTANLACGRHHDLLDNITDLKSSYEAAKIAAGGSAEDLVFAAIGGVPVVSECQGTGDTLGGCLAVHPGVNGTGTMGDPDEVARTTSAGVDQYYFEYACQRYADGADTDNPDVRPITAAYPGIRYIHMAQAFGDRGYMFSICNSDWSAAMENIALWHERDISHSSVERIIFPDACHTLHHMLKKMAWLVSGLVVYPENMLANMEKVRGMYFSQVVLLELTEAGMTREDAYARVQSCAMRVWDENVPLRQALGEDAEITGRLDAATLDRCFDLEHQLRFVPHLMERTFAGKDF